MYAIVRQGGKQYRVAAGDELVCDRVKGEVGQPFVFEKHLLISDEGQTVVTDEELSQYSIEAELVEHFDDKKVLVFKYKPKKGYRRTHGHRQAKSRVKILMIEKGTQAAKKASASKKEAAPAKVAEAKSEAVKAVAETVAEPAKKAAEKKAPEKKAVATKAAPTKAKAETKPKTEKKPAAEKKADTNKDD